MSSLNSGGADDETESSLFDSPFDIKNLKKENKIELPSEYKTETLVTLSLSMPEILKLMF